MRRSSDDILTVGAWCALLDMDQLSGRPDLWDELIGMCRHRAIRRRAFDFFHARVLEHGLARRVLETPAENTDEPADSVMAAETAFDPTGAAKASGRLFLATGNLQALVRAQAMAADAEGWRAALVWAVRLVLLTPANIALHIRVFTLLDDAGKADLLEAYGRALARSGLDNALPTLFLGAAAFWRDDLAGALEAVIRLDPDAMRPDAVLAPYRGLPLRLRAMSEERLGRFETALASFAAAHRAETRPGVDADDYYRGVEAKKRVGVPPLPDDPRTDVAQMLGFPRSGTTLLENALAAHPLIETFEEIPALRALTEKTERRSRGADAVARDPVALFGYARAAYYEEIDIRRRKPEARVLIDKLPLRSGEAAFLARLFPAWRYIFSIRHPFDVVLSCFKQRFAPNPAMENFRTVEGAVRLYDFAMSEWFAVHTLTDAAVRYVRYEELVTDFDRVVGGVLDFLGVGWNDAVAQFATAADRRASRTPSYHKVRQGLGIGVQSSWRNYGDLFQSAATRPLHKWAEFFGYPTR